MTTVGERRDDGFAAILRRIDAVECGDAAPLPLPWPRLNALVGGGLRRGEVTLLAGSPGSAKSLFLLRLLLHLHKAGTPWSLLPLEDDHSWAVQRFWALLTNRWDCLTLQADRTAELREWALDAGEVLSAISEHIAGNPRLPSPDRAGIDPIPELPWEQVAEWVGREARKGARLIAADPVTMVDFANRKTQTQEWEGQQAFIREIVGVARATDAHVILVLHLSKPRGQTGPATADDIQGSSGFVRFAHNVLLLTRHHAKENAVYRTGGMEGTIEHNRTLTVCKARIGAGSGTSLAFDLRADGPEPLELGSIKPKGKA